MNCGVRRAEPREGEVMLIPQLQIAVYLLVCYVRQGFDKNLYPQSAYAFRAFGNSFMAYMVLWEQVLTPIYAINEWEAFASLEKHKRKKQRKTQGYIVAVLVCYAEWASVSQK